MFMKMRTQTYTLILFSYFFFSGFAASSSNSSSSIEGKCKNEFSKVGVCLNYASGKLKSPSGECCSTVDDIKKREAACLCYVIQQVHDGADQFKQLGVQESKLVLLPVACKLANMTLSDCPKLLNLNSSSPDYAFFSNSSSSSAAPTKPNSVETSPAKKSDTSSSSARPQITGHTITHISIFITIFTCVLFSTEA